MTIWERLEAVKSQLAYVKSQLANGCLEAWEAKEYLNLEADYVNQIAELNDAINFYNATYA
jgi:hypothetical protein